MQPPTDPPGPQPAVPRGPRSRPAGDWRAGLPADLPGVDRAALPPVGAIRFDSRAVGPGDLFVCVPGERHDGHAFAAAAVQAGARVLVVEAGRPRPVADPAVAVIAVPDPRRALSALAAAHEGFPAEQLTVIGVTGTDGKSTTAFLALAALEGAGLRAGVLSTVESRIAGEVVPNSTRLTTQEAPEVQARLRRMVDAGCTHAVVEATSHGLELGRLDHCAFDVAVFTNLTPDHLDFHGSIEAYRAAKGRLFAMLDRPTGKRVPRAAVLNADDPAADWFAGRSAARRVRYGLDPGGDRTDLDVAARAARLGPAGSTFRLHLGREVGGEVGGEGSGREVDAAVPLPGRFNLQNATAALAAVWALGLDPAAAARGVAAAAGVPGRMERITVPGAPPAPFEVIVDYAHTPDAMRQVLDTLRPLVDGRLIVVFGAAGERSPDRRSGLGRVVAERADLAVVTEEDPRSEPPAAILDAIVRAMTAAGAVEGETCHRVPDRGEAIAHAVALAAPGDLVLIAGKGHETTIERADGPHPWDDRAAARAALAGRTAG